MTAPAVNLVIFGASGDLTGRLLLPGLGTLLKAAPHFDVHLVGASDQQISDQQWRDIVSRAMSEVGCPAPQFATLVDTTRFVTLDATDVDALRSLLDSLTGSTVLYFALPPAVTMRVCRALQSVDLPPDIRLAVEKPFGTSLESAREFNDLLATLVKEEQIFRVDHFLGKATVLNLMGLLRSGKALGDGFRGITVLFQPVSHLPEGLTGGTPRNVLMIGMTPENINLSIATTGEGDAWELETTTLSAALGDSPIRPYGQILEGILNGDPLLSVRGDVAEECWRILTPVFKAWQSGQVPLDEYHAGSSGPGNWA